MSQVTSAPIYSSASENRWNPSKLLLVHFVAGMLMTSLFLPFTHSAWRTLDIPIFRALNSMLELGKNWQTFWALANHRWSDWLEDVIFFSLVLIYILKPSQKSKKQKIRECFLIVFMMSAVIYFVNKIVFRDLCRIVSPSPTLTLPDAHRLSHYVKWITVKDISKNSFPGDHATTSMLFALLFGKLASPKMRIFIGLYCIFLCLPRMVVGAHWFSDVIVGSGSIALIAYAWFYFTPLHQLGFLRKKER